jgi:hypothetical protein
LQGSEGKTNQASWKSIASRIFWRSWQRQNRSPHFDVVDIYHPYLVIFGRGFMNKFDVVIRQQFLCMKIPAPKGVITVFWRSARGQKHSKGPYSGSNQSVSAENI